MAQQSIPSLFQDVIGSPIQADRLAADRALGAQLQQGGSAALLFAPERARRLAQTVGGITGTDTRSPEERQQGTIRSIYSSIRFNDPTSVQQGAEALRQAGFPDIANRVIAEGKRIAQVDAKDAAEQAREERAQTRFGYEVADRETAEEVDDITASVQLNADGDMADYYKRLAAKLAEARFGQQAKGALEDMRTAQKAMKGGERFVPVGKNIFDREKGIFIDGPNEGREGKLVEEVGADGRLYKYFVDPVTGEQIGEKRLQPLKGADATTTKQYRDNTSAINAVSSNTLSYNEILADLEANPFAGGAGANISTALKDKTGLRNKVSQIKTATSAAALKEALGFLPPGPATDKDMEQALKTVPPDNASSAEWTDWLTKVMRLAEVSKEYYKMYNTHITKQNSIIGFEADAAWEAAKKAAGYEMPNAPKEQQSGVVDWNDL
jgi:hypothetical protein